MRIFIIAELDGIAHLQCKTIAVLPLCCCHFWTWPMRSTIPTPESGSPVSGQSVYWNWHTVRESFSCNVTIVKIMHDRIEMRLTVKSWSMKLFDTAAKWWFCSEVCVSWDFSLARKGWRPKISGWKKTCKTGENKSKQEHKQVNRQIDRDIQTDRHNSFARNKGLTRICPLAKCNWNEVSQQFVRNTCLCFLSQHDIPLCVWV